MGDTTDFNDLHCSEGLDAVKRQIMSAISEDSSVLKFPAPHSQKKPKFTLEYVLEKFALIHGETKIWDMANRKAIKKTAFIDLVTRPIAKEWMEHPDRRTITLKDTKALSSHKGSGEQEKIIERYFFLYPTKNAWDNVRQEVIPIDVLKLAIPNDYDWWLKNPRRKEFDINNLVFDPTQKCDLETHINMYSGLPLKSIKSTARCQNILKMVKNLCNHDEEVIDWLFKWLAYPLQKVGSKLDTAVLMHSDIQGTGKSMLFTDLMPMLYGKYGSVVGQHQLESQYTEWRSQLLYASFEEIFSRNQKYSHMGTVKHMITGKTQRIEKKFVSGWEEANFMNAAFLSNELQPFPIEKSDRRMFVIWPRKTMPIELQFAAGEEIDSGDGAEAFYQYLLDYPTDGFNRHSKPPETAAKRRLIDYSLPPWDSFYDAWMAGLLEVPYCSCTSNDLYIAYSKFCRSRNEHLISQTKFSTIMATRLTKKVARHMYRNEPRNGTVFLIKKEREERPTQDWMNEGIREFSNKLESMRG